MIYLIQSCYKDDFGQYHDILKIGYCKNSFDKSRRAAYNTHNFGYKFITEREGDEKLETYLHHYFRKYRILSGSEWFIFNQEIIDKFHSIQYDIKLPREIKLIYEKHIDQINELFSEDDKILIKEILVKWNKILANYKRSNDFDYKNIRSIVENFINESERNEKYNFIYDILISEYAITETNNNDILQSFFNQFYKTGVFREKMKLFCEFMDKHRGNLEILNLVYLKIKDSRYKDYYSYYGTSGCRAVRYEEKQLIEGMKNLDKKNSLTDIIYTNFKLDNRYTLKEIKQTLKKIYQEFGITSTPKATDLNKYFKLERTRVKSDDKFVEGFKLTKLKEQ